MKFLIIGLGSMGKRRVRCLKALRYKTNDITGFDLRADRCHETEQAYGIKTYTDIDKAIDIEKPIVFIISVPPDVHHIYMKMAVELNIHMFIEASVVDTGIDIIRQKTKHKNIVVAPSATLLFHPAIKQIQEILNNDALGKISNLVYHAGQYLPDWHTYEKVSEYYVSNPVTGGCREITPFELTWITKLFGYPKRICGNFRKTIDIEGAERIDDTYNILLDYNDFLATMTVDVVSRYTTRRLLINGGEKQLRWNWDDNCIKIYDPAKGRWEVISYEMMPAAPGYNPKIGENMYVDEIKDFIDAIKGGKQFINTLEEDQKVLKLLYAIEASDKKSRFVSL